MFYVVVLSFARGLRGNLKMDTGSCTRHGNAGYVEFQLAQMQLRNGFYIFKVTS
jgi:hypothetical protein